MVIGEDASVFFKALETPDEGKWKILIELAKGPLRFATGMVSKLLHHDVSIKTETGVLGRRGTDFNTYVKTDPGRFGGITDSSPRGTYVYVREGVVYMKSDVGQIDVEEKQVAYSGDRSAVPKLLLPVPEFIHKDDL
jgi:hypothetical protein